MVISQTYLSEINRARIIKKWELEHEKIKKHILINKHKRSIKAKIGGFLSGDGSIRARKERNNPLKIHYSIAFYPDHYSMVQSYLEAFEELYGKKPVVKRKNNYYDIRISSKPIYQDLVSDFTFGVLLWLVPFHYLLDKESKIEWLKAFFDCESSIGIRQIQLQSVNKNGLEQVMLLLKEFNIESKLYKYQRKNKNWNTNYILCIMKKESRLTFLKEIGFNHTVKLAKLRKVLMPR